VLEIGAALREALTVETAGAPRKIPPDHPRAA
jgi:hypothetical protein